MHFSTLLLGLTALYTASAIPTPAEGITVDSNDAEGFKYELPNLECTRESASYLTSEEAAEADRLLEVYKDNDHSDILSNIPVGKFTPLFGVANLETWGIRLNEGGDSIFRHLAEGLEACKKDGNFALGCHPAFANGDYYICLKRKDSCFFSCD